MIEILTLFLVVFTAMNFVVGLIKLVILIVDFKVKK
jgi:hypothetical protein